MSLIPTSYYPTERGTHQLFRRGAAEVLTPNDTQKVTLIVAGCYVVAIALSKYLNKLLYPFKLVVVGMHETCHAVVGVLTCGHVEQINLDPDEGGSTRMRGGIPSLTLPAGYLGSSLIGASCITCGFDTNASKIACLVLALFWLLMLMWAWRDWITWFTVLLMAGFIVPCWLIEHSVALRFFVLFIGVMSCLYAIWDIVDDTIARKINSSDASEYARVVGCGSSRTWGAFWLLQACVFFVAGILIGVVAFKDDWRTQAEKADRFLCKISPLLCRLNVEPIRITRWVFICSDIYNVVCMP